MADPRGKEKLEVNDLLSSGADIEGKMNEEMFKMVMAESGGNTIDHGGAPPATSAPPKIQKVKMLRDHNRNLNQYFEPRAVSLGPIHHGNKKYKPSEKIKLDLARKFVNESDKSIKDIFPKIRGIITELRNYFEEEVTRKYNDNELAWILFIDGCAILQFIYYNVQNKLINEFNMKIHSLGSWYWDLFLLENQVPYRLLEELMISSQNKGEIEKSIDTFNKTNRDLVLTKRHGMRREELEKNTKGIHLLDILRTGLLSRVEQTEQKRARTTQEREPLKRDWLSGRHVHELKAAGIHVRRSEAISFRDVYFTVGLKFFPGYLWLPPLRLGVITGSKIMNLIAYELCPDFRNDLGVNSYLKFLASLINETNDVKALRKAGVLNNFLGSDIDVLQFFQTMRAVLLPNTETYLDVKYEIQEYRKNACKKWMGEFLDNYFSSPWTVLACFGVLLALLLSSIQTGYTVFSPPGPCDDFCNKFKRNL